jgi:AraC-like DNA-binding protein
MVETLNFSTRSFEMKERFARYRDIYSGGADTIALEGPVSAEVEARRLDGLVLYERRISGLGVERLAPRVRRNQFCHFTLQLNLQGEFHGDGADGFRAVSHGEILLLDMARPMRTRMPNVHLITLSVSRGVMDSIGAETDRLHGVVIPAERAAGLNRLLRSAVEKVDAQPQMLFGELLAHQLGSILGAMSLARRADREQPEEVRLRLARRFIQTHLWDEALSPAHVARAAGLSRATLYRLFDDTGGVRKYIQMLRLAQLKRSLGNPLEQRPVAALAFDAGFVSEHHASRSFKQVFGLAPGEFRREIRLSAQSEFGVQASTLKRKMAAWSSELN